MFFDNGFWGFGEFDSINEDFNECCEVWIIDGNDLMVEGMVY